MSEGFAAVVEVDLLERLRARYFHLVLDYGDKVSLCGRQKPAGVVVGEKPDGAKVCPTCEAIMRDWEAEAGPR